MIGAVAPANERRLPGSPNARWIGVAGGRERLSTPALILDLDAFERNVLAMQRAANEAGVALRPHAKSHKCIEVAHRQLEAGAIGISCATLGEAEVFADAGISGILVTSPVVAPAMIARLVAIPSPPMVVVDDPVNVAALAEKAASAGKRLDVLVELDVGQRRTGVGSIEEAIRLAKQVDSSSPLRLRGIQAYWGHLQQVIGFEERRDQILERSETVRAAIAALSATELPPEIVTGSGTGSAAIDAELGIFTELQAGSYLFMDSSYGRPTLWPNGELPFEISLFVRANVVSARRPEHAIINAGLKSFATDSGLPIATGAAAGTTYRFMGDEHGALAYPDDEGPRLELGAGLECIVSHCDPTVNLYDFLHCVRGDRLVEIWRIDARGR